MAYEKIYRISLFAAVLCCLFSCGGMGGADKKGKLPGGTTIVETGELAAVNSKAFVAQRYGRYWFNMKIVGILDHGTIVNPGDSIMQLDPTDVKKFIVDKESELETQMANLEKLIVDQANNINTIESNIKSETATFDLRKIEYESSRFESERYRRIKELEFEQAKITFAKERRKLELTKIINECDLKIQEVQVERIKREVEDAYNILPAFTIRTPIGGVFQIAKSRRTNNLLKVGDDVYPGNNMANVPELKHMKVNTYINENDFLKIKAGQKVAVRLDAMPKVVFDGEVTYVGKLCHPREPNSRQKVFDVEVKISESDERLKPGMTVSCEFLAEE